MLLVAGCDTLFTTAPDDADLLDAPVQGLTAAERAAFVRGDTEFGRAFTVGTGLGPIFNDVSCAACHSGDGRGRPENVLTRFSLDGDPYGAPGGPQLQTRAIPGAVAEVLPPGVQVSLRLPPPVFGVGLIEAIPEATILALADPMDADGDGISGRAHFVTPPAYVPATEPGGGVGPRLGRFGRKAQVSTLLQQTVEAYLQDMGVTSDFLPEENVNPQAPGTAESADRVGDPEIGASTVFAVVNYLRMLAPPAPGADTPSRIHGRAVFESIGCASCHVPSLQTGTSPIGALSNRAVALYSDLLLHDMGDDLADNRPDGAADGREWRTTPLWGLRVMRGFLNGDVFLLHDGRASSIAAAVELHGGEAAAVRARWRALSAEDRAALLDFVESR
jgi:CxxC motif-containing protein (DUF1111 family)